MAALERDPDTDRVFMSLFGEDVTSAELGWLVELAEDHSVWASLFWSIELWEVIGILAVIAAIRQWFRRKALIRDLIAQEERDEAARRRAQEEREEIDEAGAGLPPAEG